MYRHLNQKKTITLSSRFILPDYNDFKKIYTLDQSHDMATTYSAAIYRRGGGKGSAKVMLPE